MGQKSKWFSIYYFALFSVLDGFTNRILFYTNELYKYSKWVITIINKVVQLKRVSFISFNSFLFRFLKLYFPPQQLQLLLLHTHNVITLLQNHLASLISLTSCIYRSHIYCLGESLRSLQHQILILLSHVFFSYVNIYHFYSLFNWKKLS